MGHHPHPDGQVLKAHPLKGCGTFITSWMLYATTASAALAAADVFVKMAAGRLPNRLAMLIYGAVAFGVGLAWFSADRARGDLRHASGVGVAFSAVAVAL